MGLSSWCLQRAQLHSTFHGALEPKNVLENNRRGFDCLLATLPSMFKMQGGVLEKDIYQIHNFINLLNLLGLNLTNYEFKKLI